jgi:hypothetical protein
MINDAKDKTPPAKKSKLEAEPLEVNVNDVDKPISFSSQQEQQPPPLTPEQKDMNYSKAVSVLE